MIPYVKDRRYRRKLMPFFKGIFKLSIRESKSVALLSLILFVGFGLAGIFGIMTEVNNLLITIIEDKSLPKLYFLLFFVVGLIVPVIYLFFARNRPYVRTVIYPYLILLAGQILTEISLVFLLGKGIGVLIGLVFSATRVIQIKQLLSIVERHNLIKFFLYIEFLLWTFNAVQIVLNRIYPLFYI